jgi:hypothetical protein
MDEHANHAEDLSTDSTSPRFVDAQLTLIEQGISAPLDAERQARLRDRLAQARTVWTAEEIASVPDGTEPGTVYRPLMPEAAPRHGGSGHE